MLYPSINVKTFGPRIEIWSPGTLPKELNIKNLIHSNRSIPRNRTIAEIFQKFGYMENWGTGFQRMTTACQEMGLKRPVFEEETGAFVITFFKDSVNGGASGGVEDKIISLLKVQPGLKAPAISEELGIPKRTIERYLTELKARQILNFRSSPKNGGYFLLG